jgi:penicillin-binding protein 2
MMTVIANKGWYYTPHLVDSIEGGDKYGQLKPFKVKNATLNVSDSIFEEVHEGMQGTMEFGTGAAAKVPGIAVCGKTGTVENYTKGVKQEDHAFFGAFAPRDNPKIAIAVMCENAGYGATSAAPIASLLIEKYLKDSIAADRKEMEERITKKYLIPKLMRQAMARLDSIRRVKDSIRLIKEKQQEAKDTFDIEEQPEIEMSSKKVVPYAIKADSTKSDSENAPIKKQLPKKNPAILQNDKKKKAVAPTNSNTA